MCSMRMMGALVGVWLATAVSAADAVSRFTGRPSAPLLTCSSGKALLIAPDGGVMWERANCGNIHRVWLKGDWIYWSNGALYRTHTRTHVTEPVYSPAPKDSVFGFEILSNGNIVVADNVNDRIVELSPDAQRTLVSIAVNPRDASGKLPTAHHHLRMVRKTDAGTYLVACSGAHVVREYDVQGRLVWEQAVPDLAFDCVRRRNGNTVISHLDAITEYTPDHKIVWRFACADVPELKVSNLCGLQERANGNLVVGTYANGVEDGSRTTAFEVTPDCKIEWRYAAAGKRRSMMTAFLVPEWKKTEVK